MNFKHCVTCYYFIVARHLESLLINYTIKVKVLTPDEKFTLTDREKL